MKVRMFPALSVVKQATVANRRTCSCTPGTAVDVPNFDALGRDPLQNVRHVAASHSPARFPCGRRRLWAIWRGKRRSGLETLGQPCRVASSGRRFSAARPGR
jgi:hypothetical protein